MHDSVVFALVLEERAVGLLGFHVAVLGGVADGLGEDTLGEDLRVGGLDHIPALRCCGACPPGPGVTLGLRSDIHTDYIPKANTIDCMLSPNTRNSYTASAAIPNSRCPAGSTDFRAACGYEG